MARQASGKTKLLIDILERKTGLGATASETSQLRHSVNKETAYENGTGAGQIDRPFSGTQSVDGTGTTLDLVGTIASALDGSTVAPAKLRFLYVENTSASGNLLVGGSTNTIGLFANSSDILVLKPGDYLFVGFGSAGLAMTGGASDELKLAASTGTVVAAIAFAGTSV